MSVTAESVVQFDRVFKEGVDCLLEIVSRAAFVLVEDGAVALKAT